MARNDNVPHALVEQNGRKKYIQTISFTNAGALTPLNTTDIYGMAVPPNCMLVLIGDADFLYELRDSGAGASAVTVLSGSRAGVYVVALQQEFVIRHDSSTGGQPSPYQNDKKIDIIGASGSGHVAVFWVD